MDNTVTGVAEAGRQQLKLSGEDQQHMSCSSRKMKFFVSNFIVEVEEHLTQAEMLEEARRQVFNKIASALSYPTKHNINITDLSFSLPPANANGVAEADRQQPPSDADPNVNRHINMEVDKSGSGPSLKEEDGTFKVATFRSMFLRTKAKQVQEAWPMVESALAEHGISCSLDLDKRFIIFSTTRTTDPDAILNARYALQLLSMGVTPRWALSVLNGKECAIIDTGYGARGLASTHGIMPEGTWTNDRMLCIYPW